MRFLQNLPISRKLRVIILGTCTAALLSASVALCFMQFYFFKRDYRQDLEAVSRVIADTITGAITFNQPDAARDILQVLKSKPQIIRAAIVLNDGKVFAEIGDAGGVRELRAIRTAGFVERAGDLAYVQPIVEDGEALGTLYIDTNYRHQAMKLLGLYVGILLAIFAASFLVAVFISSRLEHFISDPIQTLADTARGIADRSDYSLRACKTGNDEVGAFTDTFNSMLDQIQNRDQALRHEIAERARAEQEIQRIHQQLMDASRQAGMAEVATGVLHNVGNVLNSVNVSATLIAEKISQSRTTNLVRAANLLRAQNGGLGEFLTNDPKGLLLPDYLAEASAQIAREREEALVELDLLAKNIEHIKDIVSTQQSYARVSGLVEALPLDALVEDALRMNTGGFERHAIVVTRDYAKVPPALVDKHKVLQIIVNVIRNAKYAIDDANPPEKRIAISIRQNDLEQLEVAFTDTGVGIAEENLTRIFSHGFTTREHGHGFGLHSAALAAQQMGGRLYARSDGPGKGATFILELPPAPATSTPA